MLTREEFDAIAVGDEVETPIPLMPALCEDVLVFHPTMKDDGLMAVMMTYCGITLGTAVCQATETGTKWNVK